MVDLRPLTRDNWRQCAALAVADEILVCYHDVNAAARRLYGQAGFCELDVKDGVATAVLARHLPFDGASV